MVAQHEGLSFFERPNGIGRGRKLQYAISRDVMAAMVCYSRREYENE